MILVKKVGHADQLGGTQIAMAGKAGEPQHKVTRKSGNPENPSNPRPHCTAKPSWYSFCTMMFFYLAANPAFTNFTQYRQKRVMFFEILYCETHAVLSIRISALHPELAEVLSHPKGIFSRYFRLYTFDFILVQNKKTRSKRAEYAQKRAKNAQSKNHK